MTPAIADVGSQIDLTLAGAAGWWVLGVIVGTFIAYVTFVLYHPIAHLCWLCGNLPVGECGDACRDCELVVQAIADDEMPEGVRDRIRAAIFLEFRGRETGR